MTSIRRFSLRHPLLLVLGFLLICGSTAIAQEALRPERGAMPNRSYSISDIENISLQNGNVNLSIPLASLPPIAGGKLSWTINANYNSKQWNIIRQQADFPGDFQFSPYVIDSPALDGGWTIGNQYSLELRNSNEDFDRVEYPGNAGLSQQDVELVNNYSYWKMVLKMPDGSEHEFRPIDFSPYQGPVSFLRGYYNLFPNGTPTRYYSVDGTYMFARYTSGLNWTVYMPDGTQIIQTSDGVQRIQDTNGNKIKIFSDANGTHYQDEQTGREIRKTYDPAANGGLGQTRVWYKTVTGIEQHIDVNWGTTTVQGKVYGISDWDATGSGHVCQHQTELMESGLNVVREIVFPQTEPTQPQRHFTYEYNSDTTETASTLVSWSCDGSSEFYTRQASRGWGELSRMVTPTGSIVDYSYSKDSIHFLLGSLDTLSKESIAQKKITHDGTFDTWVYAISQFDGTPSTGVSSSLTSPNGQNVTETQYCTNNPGCANGRAGLVYRTTKPFMMTERHWTNLSFSGANTMTPSGVLTLNPVVDFEYTTLLDASNNPLKMSAKAFQYDFNGNVTQTTEYDWFDPGLVSRDTQGVPTGVPGGATALRVTNNAYYNQASTSTSGNVYAKRSVSTGAPLILNATQQTTVGSSIVQLSYDGQAYGVAPTAGNMTQKKVWDDLDSKWITTSSTYDLYGNVATTTDARGKVTQLFYDDATHALPTRVVVDPQNGTGTQTAGTAYDFSTGLVTSQTDVNGQVMNIDYTNQLLGTIDPFGRPGVTKAPTITINGTNHRRRITATYLDSSGQTIVASDLNAENDKLLKTRTTTDMLGRPILSESTEDGTNYTISTRNAYLNMGQVTLTSTPMRSTAATTDSWTRTTRDGAARVKEVASFGGAAQPAWTGTAGAFTGAVTTDYNANFATITDQAGKVRRNMLDALGRLLRVDEPDASGNLGTTISPVQKTDYEYDVLGNLKKVTQGTQQRTFTYDSLSRLRTAINPESGTVTYQYDDGGNLVVKTDARAVSMHYEYDSLNRVTRRWYNGSNLTSQTTNNSPALPAGVGATDEVKSYYDSQTLPTGAPSYSRGSTVGRMVAQTYGSGTNGDYYAYDVLGRQTIKIQQTGAVNYQLNAGYSLSGSLSSLTYPSGHTISNTFDQAGRLSIFSGTLGDGTTRTYATGAVYSALGSLSTEQFGTSTPVYHKVHYNSRAQICDVRASTVNDEWGGEIGALVNYYSTPYSHCGNGSDNNGNLLMSQTIINSVYFEDRYSYDSLNRLSAVNEYLNGATFSGKQEYDYDRWGNRTLKPAPTLGTYKEFTVNTANNRLGVPASQPPSVTMSYDNAGNLTNDTYTGAGNRTYDAENKITSAWGGNNQAQLYSYDGSGQRIKHTVDGVATWQVYGFGGELLAEYAANGAATSPQKEYGYRNSELLVTAEPASAQQSTQNVSWTNAVGVSVSGNNLTKTTADAWANSGASSSQAIVSGDGYVQVTPTENTTWRMIGLSNGDANQDYTDIDFAAYLGANSICIYEASISRGCVSTYVPGDVIRVAVESGVVKYKKNGTVVYTSGVAPTYPLLVDTALWSNGATLSNVVISGLITGGAPQNTQNVSWTNTTGVSVSGNNLTKTTADAWANSGASSSQAIASGDGYVEVTPTENTTWRMIGLSNGDSNQDYTDIDFAAYLGANSLCIYEAGTSRGCVSTYVPGDVIRVAVESGVVKYKKNGTVVYTSGVAPTYPLLVDTALWSNGATLSNVVISGNLSGGGGGGSGSGVHWLVSDHLGTPRMIIDQTGLLANVKRHDYLPFGEELVAPAGGRSVPLGYVAGDGVRQQFTSKERDVETGLDYFGARYYASLQGRFTSPDDFVNDTAPLDPASWNLYTYVRNNPLQYLDPTGEKVYVGDITLQGDRDELLRRANYTYGCTACVTIDKDGFLAVDTTGLSQNVLKATAFLTDAITSNDPGKLFSVVVTNNSSEVAFGDSQQGMAGVQLPGNNFKTSAIRIRLDFGDDKSVSGDAAAKEAFLNLVFAHEVRHFAPNFTQDPSDGRKTGLVVDAINEIQQARGLPLRAEYAATKRTSDGEFVNLTFGTAKQNKNGIVRNKAQGIEVNKTSKVVTWIKRNVGGKGIN